VRYSGGEHEWILLSEYFHALRVPVVS
jgi:hypothetical protein